MREQECDLLSGKRLRERAVHINFILDAEFGTALLVDALLPQHVLCVENEWLRSHLLFNINLVGNLKF